MGTTLSSKQGQEPALDQVKDVCDLLKDLPHKEGAPVMAPFGPVAFFPAHLTDTRTVFVEKHLAAAMSAKAGSGRDSMPSGRQVGMGDGALLEMPATEAQRLLQQLLPPPAPKPQRPPPSPAASAPKHAPQPQLVQQGAQGQQAAVQLSDLVEGQTPGQLQALQAALQQLGAQLEQQAAASAAGQQLSTEGKEIVDIREEWREDLHGGGAPLTAQRAPLATPAGSSSANLEEEGGWDAASDGGSAGSADSFEDLMLRMEALEMDEAALAAVAQPAGPAAGGGAAGTAAAGGQAEEAAGRTSGAASGSKSGGFKRGFLLGRGLDPERPASTAAAQQASAAAGSASPTGEQQRQAQGQAPASDGERRQADGAAAARREAIFTGRVVERRAATPAPDPASPTAAAAAAAAPTAATGGGSPGFPGFPVVERQPQEEQQESRPPSEPQQAQRMSRFKMRRAGML